VAAALGEELAQQFASVNRPGRRRTPRWSGRLHRL